MSHLRRVNDAGSHVLTVDVARFADRVFIQDKTTSHAPEPVGCAAASPGAQAVPRRGTQATYLHDGDEASLAGTAGERALACHGNGSLRNGATHSEPTSIPLPDRRSAKSRYHLGMTVDKWWSAMPEERFWMEIAGAKSPGLDLRAPIAGKTEQPVWHWDILTQVREGDIVLHWSTATTGMPGIVGWSRAASSFEIRDHAWTPRTRGKLATAAEPRPHYVIPLADYTALPNAITRDMIEFLHFQIMEVEVQLRNKHKGFKYFPFQEYRIDEIRAQQAYLTKMPVDVLFVLNRIGQLGFEIAYEAYGRPMLRTGPSPVGA
jgi:hypothetical protein